MSAERPVPLDEALGDLDGRQAVRLHGEARRVPGLGSRPPRPEKLDQAVVAPNRRAAAVLYEVNADRASYAVRRVGQAHSEHCAADDHVDEEVQISHVASVNTQPS